jgi:CheY-like chemotaxis protein
MESRLFDVLILDVEFPDVQALETAKQIRTKERLSGGRVPIIALVKQANAGRYNKKHPEIDEFVTKPATEEQLIKKVQQLCRG